MFDELEAFMKVCGSYRAWLDCGKDLINFPEKLDQYDADMDAYCKAIGKTRRWAFFDVWNSVTKGGLVK